MVVGEDLLARAGALLAPVLPQKRAVVVTDATVARAAPAGAAGAGWQATAIETRTIIVPPGETSKSLAGYGRWWTSCSPAAWSGAPP